MRLRDARASDTQAPESLAPSTACFLSLLFSFCCSSVSVLSRVPVEMFCLAWKTFHVTDASCARWSLHRELSQHFVHDIQHFVSFIKQTE